MASPTLTNTAFLEIPISNLAVPTNVKYEDILERHGGSGGIPDPKHLETIAESLKLLARLAQSRSEQNDLGMRTLSAKRKEVLEQEREREQERRDQERKETARREAAEEEDAREKKNGKAKKKERSRVREEKAQEKAQEKPQERPLNYGAHGRARQDGLDIPLKGEWKIDLFCSISAFMARCSSVTRRCETRTFCDITSMIFASCVLSKPVFTPFYIQNI